MVNIFNREFVNHTAHMKAKSKTTCVPTSHSNNSTMLFLGPSLQYKRIWSKICRQEITSVLQRRAWSFLRKCYLFEWERKKRAPKILSNEMIERNRVYIRSKSPQHTYLQPMLWNNLYLLKSVPAGQTTFQAVFEIITHNLSSLPELSFWNTRVNIIYRALPTQEHHWIWSWERSCS